MDTSTAHLLFNGRFSEYATTLNSVKDSKQLISMATEIRECIEIVHTPEYGNFLNHLIPVLTACLRGSAPIALVHHGIRSPTEEDAMRQARGVLLGVLKRLPSNEVLKPHIIGLATLLMGLLETEEEDNGVACVGILDKLFKNYPILQPYTERFLAIVQQLYINMPQAVHVFDRPQLIQTTAISSTAIDPLASTSAMATPVASPASMTKAMFSFRVLKECPIIVVMLLQLYKQSVETTVNMFVPHVVRALVLNPVSTSAREAGSFDRTVYTEFIAAQVKTLSFLAYILRAFHSALASYADHIPKIVIQLMLNCPPEASAVRKELLIGSRHIMASPFRKGFVNYMDQMLCEERLVGTGRTAYLTLRPMAYSMLADLVHHVRSDLTPKHLNKAVYLYSRCIYDHTLPVSIQTMSGKLLLNLVECVVKKSEHVLGRELLLRIFETFIDKFGSLRVSLPVLVSQYHCYERDNNGGASNSKVTDDMTTSTTTVPAVLSQFSGSYTPHHPIQCVQPVESALTSLKDHRQLIKTLVLGLKNVAWGLNACAAAAAAASSSSSTLSSSLDVRAPPPTTARSSPETDLWLRLLEDGLSCLSVYESTDLRSSNNSHNKDVREMIEHVCAVFTMVDVVTFQEVFGAAMPFLVTRILESERLLAIPQHFLANPAVSRPFGGTLLRFLLDRLSHLGGDNQHEAAVLLRLFKLVFGSVTLFPESNEAVLLPHLSSLISQSLELAASSSRPINFLLLLRALFRAIGGGKFELLYEEFLPLLPQVFEGRNRLQSGDHSQELQDLFVQLCLTVPVRLSALLPYLHNLMPPLVLALRSGPDLVSQAMRTLELCIDNLTPEFLDPVIDPVRSELMHALWKHVRPQPYNVNHSGITVRILGKLGGRNRPMLLAPPNLDVATGVEDMRIALTFDGSTGAINLPIDAALHSARSVLLSATEETPVVRQAFELTRATCGMLLSTMQVPDGGGAGAVDCLTRACRAASFASPHVPNWDSERFAVSVGLRVARDVSTQREHLALLLGNLFTVAALPGVIGDEAKELLDVSTRHFTIVVFKEGIHSPPLVTAEPEWITSDTYFNTLLLAMTCKHRVPSVAERALDLVIDTCLIFMRSMSKNIDDAEGENDRNLVAVSKLAIFTRLVDQLCACCYEREWHKIVGAIAGLRQLTRRLPTSWTRLHHVRIYRSLLHSFKDLSTEVSVGAIASVREYCQCLLRCVYKDVDKVQARVVADAAANEIDAVAAASVTTATGTVATAGSSTDGDIVMEDKSTVVSSVSAPAVHNSASSWPSPVLKGLLTLLTTELSSTNMTVREEVALSLTTLSELCSLTLVELLRPCLPLLSNIMPKTLRALPMQLQVGLVDALRYCLELGCPANAAAAVNTPTSALLLPLSNEMIKTIMEVLTICEAEDTALFKQPSYKNAPSFVSLRASGMRLLSAAVRRPDLMVSQLKEARNRIVGVFFRYLSARSPELSSLARNGLAVLVAESKLPKELLQSSLRPVLLQLADYWKLNLPLLELLSHLLRLLTHCFNVTLGDKLLEHLMQWTDPVRLAAATSNWKVGDDVRIATALMETFHLLPPAAFKFLPDLVNVTLTLERNLWRDVRSPFRLPLIRFLNRYSGEAVAFFFQSSQLHDPPTAHLFQQLLHMDEAKPLREFIAFNKVPQILSLFDVGQEEEKLSMQYNGVCMVLILLRTNTVPVSWLEDNPSLVSALRRIWNTPVPLVSGNDSERMNLPEMRQLAECLVYFARSRPDDVDIIFELIRVIGVPALVDFGFLIDYVENDVICNSSLDHQRRIIVRFLELYLDSKTTTLLRVQCIRHLVIPLLSTTNADLAELLLPGSLQVFVDKLFAVTSNEQSEELRIELLQLSTLLVVRCPQLLHEHRKELIKFAWNHLKGGRDMTVRHCGYLLACRFIEAYDTPQRIILQVYVALLRAHQPEARNLVRQAMDVLLPAMHARLSCTDVAVGTDVNVDGDEMTSEATTTPSSHPTWMKWTKKIIVEEGHTLNQMVHIWLLPIRNERLFYPCRGLFIPHMVNSLARMGLITTSPFENRKVAVELAELVVRWYRRSIDEPATKSNDVMACGDEPEYTPTPSVKEMVVNFLIRVACHLREPAVVMQSAGAADELAQRAVTALVEALQSDMWPDASIKFSYFEKTLARDLNAAVVSFGPVCQAIDVLHALLGCPASSDYLSELGEPRRLLTHMLLADDVRVVNAVGKLLGRMLTLYPMGIDNESRGNAQKSLPNIDTFYSSIGSHIELYLRTFVTKNVSNHMNEASVGVKAMHIDQKLTKHQQKPPPPAVTNETAASETRHLYGTLHILTIIGEIHPSFVDAHVPSLVACLARVIEVQLGDDPPTGSVPPDHPRSILLTGLALVTSRTAHLGNMIQIFLSSLYTIIESSRDPDLVMAIIDCVSSWIPLRGSSFPTLRDISSLIGKMTSLESRFDASSPQVLRFVDVVRTIYCDPALASSEATVELEPAFLAGLRCTDPSRRSMLFSLYDSSVPKSLGVRLQHIVSGQNWEPMGTHYWLCHALDFVLAAANTDNTPLYSVATWLSPQPDIFSLGTADSTTYYEDFRVDDEMASVLGRHVAYLTKLRTKSLSTLVLPLRQLCQSSPELTEKIWLAFFPRAWASLIDADREKVLSAIPSFFALDYHRKIALCRPNVVRTMLEGLSRCTPVPPLPVGLLRYLGITHNAAHTSISMLYHQGDAALDALAHLYVHLDEHDMWFGLWSQRAQLPGTRLALSLEQQGLWAKAQIAYEQVMQEAASQQHFYSRAECALWERHWAESAKKLGQSDLLLDFARTESMLDLTLECAWKLGDWATQRQALVMAEANNIESARLHIYKAYLFICQPERDFDQVMETICEEGIQLALRQWHSLPSIVSDSHMPLLQMFQQFVELYESFQITSTLKHRQPLRQHTIQVELKGVLGTWRERLPHPCDDIIVWSEILTWRHHVFAIINNAFAPNPKDPQQQGNSVLEYLGYHETAWTINRFAHVARKHNLMDVCLNALNKIYQLPNIEIQDAFLKLREQAKCYYHLAVDFRNGLDIINSTNLSYFTVLQKAEFFALKGLFLARMQHSDEANASFSTAIQICDQLPEAWSAWGEYCEQVFRSSSGSGIAPSVQFTKWGVSAITCYLQASRNDNERKGRKYLARVLWLLTYDGAEHEISEAFVKYSEYVPASHWCIFVPQLLTAISSSEANAVIPLLKRFGKAYPQALYYMLRTCFLETRQAAAHAHALQQAQLAQAASSDASAATAAAAAATSQQQFQALQQKQLWQQQLSNVSSKLQRLHSVLTTGHSMGTALTAQQREMAKSQIQVLQNQQSSLKSKVAAVAQSDPAPMNLQHVTSIMAVLRMAHPLLTTAIETVIEEMISRFKLSAEEELMRTTQVLLTECLQRAFSQTATPLGTPMSLPSTVLTHVKRLLSTFFPHNERMRQKFGAYFARDFQFGNPGTHLENTLVDKGSQLTVAELLKRLRRWQRRLRATVATLPPTLRLQDLSRHLICLPRSDIHMFGEHLNCNSGAGAAGLSPVTTSSQYQQQTMSHECVCIDRFLPCVEVLRKHSQQYRRLSVRGSDGNVYRFVVQHTHARHARAEERIMQLFRTLNGLLQKNKETCRRQLAITVPAIIPLSPLARLFRSDKPLISLEDVLETHCLRHGTDPDALVLRCFDRLCPSGSGDGGTLEASDDTVRLELFRSIQREFVPPDMLLRYIMNILPDVTHFWMFRKRFVSQLALVAFVSHVLCLGHRLPHTFNFSPDTGNVFCAELYPVMNPATGYLESSDIVPFRLTPNIYRVISQPTGMMGLFAGSIVAVARCVAEKDVKFMDMLRIVLKDELISFFATRQAATAQTSTSSGVVPAAARASNDMLIDKVARNVKVVTSRISSIVVNNPTDTTALGTPIDARIYKIIEHARNETNLIQMDPTWHAWL